MCSCLISTNNDNMDVIKSTYYMHTPQILQRVEDYTRDAYELISRMADLHQRLVNLDGFRMSESNDDLEFCLELSSELTSITRHVLQIGNYTCKVFHLVFFSLLASFQAHWHSFYSNRVFLLRHFHWPHRVDVRHIRYVNRDDTLLCTRINLVFLFK